MEGKQRIEARPWRCGGVVGLVEAAMDSEEVDAVASVGDWT